MERWAIKNKTRGTLEIRPVRRTPLQPLERLEFDGDCPDELKWLVGTRQAELHRLEPAPVPAKPAAVNSTPAAASAQAEAEPAAPAPAKPTKSTK